MGRESWGVRDRRTRVQASGSVNDGGDRSRRWMNRFEVLDRTGNVDDTQEFVRRSTPVRVERDRVEGQERNVMEEADEGLRGGDARALDEGAMEEGEDRGEQVSRKRTVEERSPDQRENVRVNRARMDEFDLGKMYEEISKKIVEGTKSLIEKAPESFKKELGAGLDLLLEGMKEIMNGVSDKVALERRKREAGEMDIDDKLEKLKDEVNGIKEVNSDVVKETIKDKIKSSEREMERKIKGAMCNLKIMDFDFGGEMQDRVVMVRKVARNLREDVHPDSRAHFDRILRRTRIQILGRRTETRKVRDRMVHTAPILLECQGRQDASELDGILKDSGYFSSFHWPQEIMEFVNEIRDEVRYQGYEERDFFVKVRPEDRNGEIRLRAEVKEKNGGRWQMKAMWACPPANKEMWSMVKDLWKPVIVAKGSRN
jgi:hypothetical protein